MKFLSNTSTSGRHTKIHHRKYVQVNASHVTHDHHLWNSGLSGNFANTFITARKCNRKREFRNKRIGEVHRNAQVQSHLDSGTTHSARIDCLATYFLVNSGVNSQTRTCSRGFTLQPIFDNHNVVTVSLPVSDSCLAQHNMTHGCVILPITNGQALWDSQWSRYGMGWECVLRWSKRLTPESWNIPLHCFGEHA